jgi:hypothetical protein
MITNEYSGTIDIPEFYAKIEGELPENLYIENALPEIRERAINSQFYQSINHITNIYPLSGRINPVNYMKMIVFHLKFLEFYPANYLTIH